jgi:hypothetical protein
MSELRTDTITASDGTSPVTLTKQVATKVLGGFNQEGSTDLGLETNVSSRFSLNVSSYTDSATSIVLATFTNAFSDLEYITAGISRGDRRTLNIETGTGANNTTSKRETRGFNNAGEVDSIHHFQHFGDLA